MDNILQRVWVDETLSYRFIPRARITKQLSLDLWKMSCLGYSMRNT